MKKVIAALVICCLLAGVLPVFADGGNTWIYTYEGLVKWITGGDSIAQIAPGANFAWPTDSVTLTANGEKTLSYAPHPSIPEVPNSWHIPAHVTINGVELDYGTLQGGKETASLTISGSWNGDVQVGKAFTLSAGGKIGGNLTVNTDKAVSVLGDIGGDFGIRTAENVTVDSTVAGSFNVTDKAVVQGDLTAQDLHVASGRTNVVADLTVKSGHLSVTDFSGNGKVTVESGATLSFSSNLYTSVTVKNGAVLKINGDGSPSIGINQDANLHIEEGGTVYASTGLLLYYEDESSITGKGTINFYNDADSNRKYGVIYMSAEGEQVYYANDGTIPHVDATVVFGEILCEHKNLSTDYRKEETSHAQACLDCGRDIWKDHRWTAELLDDGSKYTCSVCGYSYVSGVRWEIEDNTLKLVGSGQVPTFYSPADAPWHSVRGSLTDIQLSDGIDFINATFQDCVKVQSVRLPSSLTQISAYAFKGCTALKSVTISDKVTDVDYGAFRDCPNLTDIYYTGTQAQWNEIHVASRNDDFKKATVHFLTPTLSVAKEENTITVAPAGVEEASHVLVAYFAEGVLMSVQKQTYQGAALTFENAQGYDYAKVFAWDKEGKLIPQCESALY